MALQLTTLCVNVHIVLHSQTLCCVSPQLLGSQELQDDHEIKAVEETASDLISAVIDQELHAQPKTVQLTIAPTRVHVVENEPWV